MDAVKVLGAMLGNRARRAPGNGQVLSQVLNGVANITAAANSGHRFPPTHHVPLEHIVRDGVRRHHRAGGRFPSQVDPYLRGARPVPAPIHDDDHHHGHHAGISYRQRAELLITAMAMAAQSDGQLDADEQARMIERLQPLDAAEERFLRQQLSRRHDLSRFVDAIPNGLEYEVYTISLMAIRLDTAPEAAYLRSLAECMRLSPAEVNDIHARVGAPALY